MLVRDGFDAMNMTTLAERVGIGTGAVYLEFRSKDELVETLLKDGTRAMAREVSRRMSLGGHDPRRLSDVYRVGAEVLLDDALYTAAFLDPDAVLGKVVSAAHHDRYRARHEGFRVYLQELADAGLLAPDTDLDGLGLTLSSYTIGLLSVARVLGPLTPEDLRSSLEVMAAMVSSLERDPVAGPLRPSAAYSELLERLEAEDRDD